MADVFKVAKFFIQIANQKEDEMTNLRLNKLLYFAQAWFLARYDRPLFANDVVAWKLGPVVRTVYDQYRSYGENNIILEGNEGVELSDFTEEELNTLLDITEEYGKYATSFLVDVTHKSGSPWSCTTSSEVIAPALMKEYYRKESSLESIEDILKGLPPPVEPSCEIDGIPVFPKALFDEE